MLKCFEGCIDQTQSVVTRGPKFGQCTFFSCAIFNLWELFKLSKESGAINDKMKPVHKTRSGAPGWHSRLNI